MADVEEVEALMMPTYIMKLNTSMNDVTYKAVKVDQQSSVHLRCTVIGDNIHEEPGIHWLKDSENIRDEDLIAVTVEEDGLATDLKIASFDERTHTANYDCRVKRRDRGYQRAKVRLSANPIKYNMSIPNEDGDYPCSEQHEARVGCIYGQCWHNYNTDITYCKCRYNYSGNRCQQVDHFVEAVRIRTQLQYGVFVLGLFVAMLMAVALLMTGLWLRQRKRRKSGHTSHRTRSYDEEKAMLVNNSQLPNFSDADRCWKCGVLQHRLGNDAADFGGADKLFRLTLTENPLIGSPKASPRSASLPANTATIDYDPTCTDCVEELRRFAFPTAGGRRGASISTHLRPPIEGQKPRSATVTDYNTAIGPRTDVDGAGSNSSNSDDGERTDAVETPLQTADSFIVNYLPLIQRRKARLYGVSEAVPMATVLSLDPAAEPVKRRSISSPTSPEAARRQRHQTANSAGGHAAHCIAKSPPPSLVMTQLSNMSAVSQYSQSVPSQG